MTSVLALVATTAAAVTALQTDDREDVVSPEPDRKSGLIAFTTQGPRDMAPWIAVTPVNGRPVTRLQEGSSPSWSPDGTRIAFACHYPRSRDPGGGICTMDADGTNVQRVTEPEAPGADEEPSWGPNGEIAFSRNYMDGSPRDIGVVDENGGEIRIITGESSDDYSPEWSPDGERIVFIRVPGGTLESSRGGGQPWVMKPDGTDLQRATGLPGSPNRPAWSPDGRRIAFDDAGNTIWIVPTEGGAPTVLKETGGFVSWSPDSDRLVFTCTAPRNDNDICIADVDGSNREAVVDTRDNEADPDWQPAARAPAPKETDSVLSKLPRGWTELPAPPEARVEAATAWTGDELIVWSGYVYSGYSDEVTQRDGFSFDARTKTWSRIAQSPLQARSSPASVWTGTELLVWGGARETGHRAFFADGAAYAPTTDAWRKLPPAPISARAPLYVWTGRELIVWGSALGSEEEIPTDGAAYDPAEDSWRTIAGAPSALGRATVTWTGTEMIALGDAGEGKDGSSTAPAAGLAYNPTTDTWRRLPDSQLSNNGSTVSWTGEEMIAWDYLHNSAAYDPESDTWRQLPKAPLEDYECGPRSVAVGTRVFGDYCGQMALFQPAEDGWRDVTREAGSVGWGYTLHAAGDVALLIGRNIETKESGLFAYRP